MHQMWRLSEGGPRNLGLACTGDGLSLGRLVVAIPKGRMTPQRREIFEAVRSWAKTLPNPVDVTFIEF